MRAILISAILISALGVLIMVSPAMATAVEEGAYPPPTTLLTIHTELPEEYIPPFVMPFDKHPRWHQAGHFWKSYVNPGLDVLSRVLQIVPYLGLPQPVRTAHPTVVQGGL